MNADLAAHDVGIARVVAIEPEATTNLRQWFIDRWDRGERFPCEWPQ